MFSLFELRNLNTYISAIVQKYMCNPRVPFLKPCWRGNTFRFAGLTSPFFTHWNFTSIWSVWVRCSGSAFQILFYSKQDANRNVSSGCQNIANIILLNPKRAKHTGREKNTCKHTAAHTPPTIINTFWQPQPKASIIVDFAAGNFIFCLLVDFILSSSGTCWQSLNLIRSCGWKALVGEKRAFRKSKTAV